MPLERYDEFELLGHHWIVKSGIVQTVREKVIPAIFADKRPHLRVIKQKFLRDLYIYPEDSPEVFIKVHKHRRRAERIKSLVRRSKAHAEWSMGCRMFEAGLPVAEPYGYGEKRSRGLVTSCILLQRALPECEAFNSFVVNSAGDPTTVKQVLRSLGELIGRMHSLGFWHPDLHAGNLLVGPEPEKKIWLVDLHAAGAADSVLRRRRLADLTKLVFSLRDILTEPQLLEILHGYDPEADEKATLNLLRRLQRGSDWLYKRHIRSRSKRCLKTSGGFVVEKLGDLTLYRKRSFDGRSVLTAIDRHEKLTSAEGPGLVKATPKMALTAFAMESGGSEKIYVKEFLNIGFVKFLEDLFYTHKGKRAWKVGHRLNLLGVPCAELIALAEKRAFGFLTKSYLLMRELPDSIQLDTLLVRNYFRLDGRLNRDEFLRKRRLIEATARSVRALHDRKVYHKDLSAKNVLVGTKADGDHTFYVVDLDSIQFPRRLSLRRRIKNLAQLTGVSDCVTATDRLRFYMRYFERESLSLKDKVVVAGICRISRRRLMRARKADQQRRAEWAAEGNRGEDSSSLQQH